MSHPVEKGAFSLRVLRDDLADERDYALPTRDEALALLAVVEAARNIIKRLDDARAWNAERNRKASVQDIDFAIGATLSLRKPLEAFDA